MKIPWEILIAVLLNLLVICIFVNIRNSAPRKALPPPEIAVDISDFTPPVPREMPTPEQSLQGESRDGRSMNPGTVSKAVSAEQLSEGAMHDFTPEAEQVNPLLGQTVTERKNELARIERGVRFFDGINQIQSGQPEGVLPAGHQTGVSYRGRSDPSARGRMLKRHGGSAQTESAVEKALNFLSASQNPDGSWGSRESFKTGDAAALSSLALLAFFAHGENFSSGKYGDTIRKGCDFLLELANYPNIEYAGHGFGHAILTYALAEGYAVSGSMSLRNALENRLKFILAHQNKFGSFAPDYSNTPLAPPTPEQLEDPLYREIVVGEPACDLSLLGWHIQAMTAAQNAGIQMEGLDQGLMLAAEALVKIHQAKKGGFSQGINMKRFPDQRNLNPVGLLGLQLLNSGKSSPANRAERIIFEEKMPKWTQGGGFPLYRWYYQTQAVFQAEKGRGKRWELWNENLKKELLEAQKEDGSWSLPGGDNSFKLKNKGDLAVYSSSLCALMMQVYYRYLPSYSIAESVSFSTRADDFDLGGKGLITRLPGGADPLAPVILGTGVNEMAPVLFGKFDGIPADNKAPHVENEFRRYASMRSTIAVRKAEEWPQTLQPNQRIALFFDDLLPRNFKGNLRLLLGVVGSEKEAFDYRLSFEAVINGKRLYNSILTRNKQLVELVVPNDVMQPFGNILQIRNNGKGVLAFDAAEISALHKVGPELHLLCGEPKGLPASLRRLFTSRKPVNEEVCKLPGNGENRQLLPEITCYEKGKSYIGEYPAIGSESMGNEFQLHYLRQSGREIVDWISGGGSGVRINNISDGGKFFDSIFHTEYPALSALRQAAKLFEGNPHRLSVQLYPKYGEKPMLFGSAAAACNAAGVATIVIAKRFPFPEESEVTAVVPWSGNTRLIVERGFFPDRSPFAGFAPKIERMSQNITIENNVFRYSGVFPELTVIRLYRKGVPELKKAVSTARDSIPEVRMIHNALRNLLPDGGRGLKKYSLRSAGGFAAVYGQNGSFSRIPVTQTEEKQAKEMKKEQESIMLTFRANASVPNRFDSVYLTAGAVPEQPLYLSFHVYPRYAGLKKQEKTSWIPLRFALCERVYSTTVSVDRWQLVVLPLNGINPAWRSLRFLEPGRLNRNLQSVSYELNDISVWCK